MTNNFDNPKQNSSTITRTDAVTKQPNSEQDTHLGTSKLDNQAEWVVLGLLGVVGCLGLAITASDGWRFLRNEDAYLPPEAAILAAALFGIGYWAASRIGGIKPVLPTIPLLVLASFPLIAPAERLSEVARWKNEAQEKFDELSPLKTALEQTSARAEAAHNRLDKMVIYPASEDENFAKYDTWLESQRAGRSENHYPFTAVEDEAFCFLTGVYLSVRHPGMAQKHEESSFEIKTNDDGSKFATAEDNQNYRDPGIKGKVVCVGLPVPDSTE